MNERQFNLIHGLVGLSAECRLSDFIRRAKEDFAPSAIRHGLLALEQNGHIALEETQAGPVIVRLNISARKISVDAVDGLLSYASLAASKYGWLDTSSFRTQPSATTTSRRSQ